MEVLEFSKRANQSFESEVKETDDLEINIEEPEKKEQPKRVLRTTMEIYAEKMKKIKERKQKQKKKRLVI